MADAFDPNVASARGTLFGLATTQAEARLVVLPVPFEATTSFRRGTAGGPAAILAASGQLDLWDRETGDPWRHGIALWDDDPAIAALNAAACGDADRVRMDIDKASALDRVNAAGNELNTIVCDWTRARLDDERIPAILGGDHSVPLGAMRAALDRHEDLGFLHIDAHADLRCSYEGFDNSHASIIYNLVELGGQGAIVQVGIRDQCDEERDRAQASSRISQFLDIDIGNEQARGRSWTDMVEEILSPLPQRVWVTFDIDGLDPSLCPNTGTPVPGGLSWREVLHLLSQLGTSGRQIVGFDLCEVADAEWDAIVGSRILYKLAGWALSTSPVG